MNRRNFLKYLAFSLGSLYLGKKLVQKQFSGKLLGSSQKYGHLIRDNALNNTKSIIIKEEYKKVIIIGGGIAGLSAAWWLKRNGFEDFVLLELEKEIGGNSHSGPNYPWGAHYIPIANLDSEYQKLLFEELGIIEGYDSVSQLPIYNELFLCHEQEERLWKDGKWQNGLIPQYGLQKEEAKEISRFFKLIQELKHLKGKDNKAIFSIPLAFSSQDHEFLQLDKISMKSWLRQNNFQTKPLFWYINYCCLDDYGIGLEKVSAWAGLHYFASRRGKAANASDNSIITWPEGNGWIVKRLKERLMPYLRTENLVYKIQNSNDKIVINYLETKTNKQKVLKSEYVIWAAPRFVAKHIIENFQADCTEDLNYIPWLVANITLSKFDSNMAWDNVNYHNQSLGYISANHQKIGIQENKNIITYYLPLEAEKRHYYQLKNHQDWVREIINDLKTTHIDIDKYIENIDVWLWGHGMISPSINFIWGENRQKMLKPWKNLYFAHSDMSGISIFEEAQYQGIEAAKRILKLIF